jgi:hypothetical protein
VALAVYDTSLLDSDTGVTATSADAPTPGFSGFAAPLPSAPPMRQKVRKEKPAPDTAYL